MIDNLLTLIRELRSLIKASTMVVGARIIGGLIGIVSQIIVARYMGAESLGLYFLAFSLATVLSILFSLGYPSIIARFVADHHNGGKTAIFPQFLSSARRDIVITSICGVFITSLLVLLLPPVSQDYLICLLIGVLTAPPLTFMKLNGALANAHKKFMISYLPDLFFRPLLMLVLIALFLGLTDKINIVLLVGGHLIVVLFLAILQGRTTRNLSSTTRPQPSVKEKEHSASGTTKKQRARWRAHALPMVIATLFFSVFSDLDLVILGLLLETRELAIFGASLKIALFLAFSIQVVHQLIIRDLADAMHAQKRALQDKIIAHANMISISLSLGALFVVLLFGENVLRIFGEEFVEGYDSLVILVLAQLIRAVAGPATQVLVLSGDEKHSLPVFAGGMVLLVVANFALVPLLHLNGAAIAALIVTLGWSMGLMIVARKKTGLVTAALPIPRWC
ncbi:MAG: oligosaccharide flippase family protein [bacterium]|nr:oligosaccharide flippase family protein [bacterium]